MIIRYLSDSSLRGLMGCSMVMSDDIQGYIVILNTISFPRQISLLGCIAVRVYLVNRLSFHTYASLALSGSARRGRVGKEG